MLTGRGLPNLQRGGDAWQALRVPPRNLNRASLASEDRESYAELAYSEHPATPVRLPSAVAASRQLLVTPLLQLDLHGFAYRRPRRPVADAIEYATARPSSGVSRNVAWIHTRKADRGYFHFLADHLQALEQGVRAFGDDLPVLVLPEVRPSYRAWGDYFFRHFDIEFTWFKPDRPSRLTTVLALPSPAASGHFDPVLAARVRRRVVGDSIDQGNRRLFVLRTRNRRVRNLDEILPILRHFGVEIIDFDEMEPLAQVEVCASTSLLVGPHGAGLANQWWMPQGSTVLELIRPSPWNNTCFWRLACALDHDYVAVSTQRAVTTGNPEAVSHLRNGDLIVPPAHLEGELRTILEAH